MPSPVVTTMAFVPEPEMEATLGSELQVELLKLKSSASAVTASEKFSVIVLGIAKIPKPVVGLVLDNVGPVASIVKVRVVVLPLPALPALSLSSVGSTLTVRF